MSGKTTLARKLALGYRETGIKSLCLDPIGDPKWAEVVDYLTADPTEFRQVVQSSRSCAIFIDESGEVIGRYNADFFFLATRARHSGHRSHFITQRPAQLSPTVRDQCSKMFLFGCSFSDSKILSDEWGKDLTQAPNLDQGQFFDVPRFGTVEKRRIF
jgi:hypothetical protein